LNVLGPGEASQAAIAVASAIEQPASVGDNQEVEALCRRRSAVARRLPATARPNTVSPAFEFAPCGPCAPR